MFTIPIDQATTAYAFDVDADDLQADARAGAPGWFFMFQEHAYRLRFGFAEAPRPVFTTWTDLSWPQVEDQRGFASVAPLPGQPIDPQDRNWGRDAADTARIALRLPVRIGIHSSALVGR
jgi:hypothetical protein